MVGWGQSRKIEPTRTHLCLILFCVNICKTRVFSSKMYAIFGAAYDIFSSGVQTNSHAVSLERVLLNHCGFFKNIYFANFGPDQGCNGLVGGLGCILKVCLNLRFKQ